MSGPTSGWTPPLREELRGIEPYGAPQLDVPVQLNVNENPYAPSPGCVADIAAAVATAGTIGFVGLVAPHLARLTVGEDHRHFLPASLLIGALLVSLASAAAKTLIPGVLLPVGIVTSLIGLPVFFVLIARVAR